MKKIIIKEISDKDIKYNLEDNKQILIFFSIFFIFLLLICIIFSTGKVLEVIYLKKTSDNLLKYEELKGIYLEDKAAFLYLNKEYCATHSDKICEFS